MSDTKMVLDIGQLVKFSLIGKKSIFNNDICIAQVLNIESKTSLVQILQGEFKGKIMQISNSALSSFK